MATNKKTTEYFWNKLINILWVMRLHVKVLLEPYIKVSE